MRSFIIALIFTFLFVSNWLFSQTTLNISNLSGRDTASVISGNYIAWQHDDGDEEIYLYNSLTDTKIAITQNSTNDILPHLGVADLFNSGDYVTLLTWLHWDGTDYEVAYCNVDDLATIYYVTNDNVDQGKSYISYLGIVWTQLVSADQHVFVYYNSTTRDASSELGGPPMDNCSSCGLQVRQGRPIWSLAYTVGKPYSNELIRNNSTFNLSYGYCVDNSTSYTQHESGSGIMVQVKEDDVTNNSEIVGTVYANNLNTCENISQNLVKDYEVRTEGLGVDGASHIGYFTKTGLEENVVVYKKDWYTNGSIGTTVNVTNSDSPKKNLVAMQNNFAWLEYDGNDWEVFWYDGTTILQVTDNSVDEQDLAIEYLASGSPTLIWKSRDGALAELFLFNPSAVTSLKRIGLQSVEFSPNPVTENKFQITGLANRNNLETISILDSHGNVIWVNSDLSNINEYSFKNILPGLYVVKVAFENSVVFRKLVIQ